MRPLATLLVPVAAPDREPTSAELDLIEQLYGQAGLAPCLRLTPLCDDSVAVAIVRRGFSRRDRVRSIGMVIAGVSSMKNGAEFISCAASTTRPKSSSFTSPRRMRRQKVDCLAAGTWPDCGSPCRRSEHADAPCIPRYAPPSTLRWRFGDAERRS